MLGTHARLARGGVRREGGIAIGKLSIRLTAFEGVSVPSHCLDKFTLSMIETK